MCGVWIVSIYVRRECVSDVFCSLDFLFLAKYTSTIFLYNNNSIHISFNSVQLNSFPSTWNYNFFSQKYKFHCVCVCDFANLVLREYLTDFFANLISYFFHYLFFCFVFVSFFLSFNAVHNYSIQIKVCLRRFLFVVVAWNKFLHVLNFICFSV